MESPDTSNWAPQSPDLSAYHLSATVDVEPIQPQQHQGYRGSISHSYRPYAHPYSPPTSSSPVAQSKLPTTAYMPRGVRKQPHPEGDYLPDAPPEDQPPAKRGKKAAQASEKTDQAAQLPPGTEGIEVKTKFPVARIKRIMQADDDVGKVAQVTPVVVSKALELFMISLVTKAASEARGRNSKRVTPAHLKQAVEKEDQFDFLGEIVSKVADAPAAQKHDDDAMDADGKKRKGAGRRKKKVEDDDDF